MTDLLPTYRTLLARTAVRLFRLRREYERLRAVHARLADVAGPFLHYDRFISGGTVGDPASYYPACRGCERAATQPHLPWCEIGHLLRGELLPPPALLDPWWEIVTETFADGARSYRKALKEESA